jgi:hypothetical protein
MAANTSPIFGLTANLAEVTFVNADGTTAKTVFTAGADGGVLKHINVVSDDTATVQMEVYVDDGVTAYLLGVVDVVTLSGTDGTNPSVDLMSGTLIPGLGTDGELFIPTGYTVEVAPIAAVTAAKTVTVVGIGIDY